jgi:hypothetical protein
MAVAVVSGVAVQELAMTEPSPQHREAPALNLLDAIRRSAHSRVGRPLLTAYAALFVVSLVIVVGCVLLAWCGSR